MQEVQSVLAVCVNWNGREVLPGVLESLQNSSYPNLQIVIVDSASEDDSTQLVPASIELIQLSENLGYGYALNAAIRRHLPSAPDYFLVLNNDVTFGPELIGRLVHFARSIGPGVFGPRVLISEEGNRLESAWGRVTWSHVLASFAGRQAVDGPEWNHVRKVELLLGCFLLIHRSVVERIGLFDESFFMYHEEIDFLYRAGKEGFPVYYCPFEKVFHRGGFATRKNPWKKTYWLRRNTVYFLRKHQAGGIRWSYFAVTLLGSLTFNLLTLRWTRLRHLCRGVKDGLNMAVSK